MSLLGKLKCFYLYERRGFIIAFLTGYNVPYPLSEEPRTKPSNIISLKYTKGVS